MSVVSTPSSLIVWIARSAHGWKSGPTWRKASASTIRFVTLVFGSHPWPWSPVGTRFSTVIGVSRATSRPKS